MTHVNEYPWPQQSGKTSSSRKYWIVILLPCPECSVKQCPEVSAMCDRQDTNQLGWIQRNEAKSLFRGTRRPWHYQNIQTMRHEYMTIWPQAGLMLMVLGSYTFTCPSWWTDQILLLVHMQPIAGQLPINPCSSAPSSIVWPILLGHCRIGPGPSLVDDGQGDEAMSRNFKLSLQRWRVACRPAHSKRGNNEQPTTNTVSGFKA